MAWDASVTYCLALALQFSGRASMDVMAFVSCSELSCAVLCWCWPGELWFAAGCRDGRRWQATHADLAVGGRESATRNHLIDLSFVLVRHVQRVSWG